MLEASDDFWGSVQRGPQFSLGAVVAFDGFMTSMQGKSASQIANQIGQIKIKSPDQFAKLFGTGEIAQNISNLVARPSADDSQLASALGEALDERVVEECMLNSNTIVPPMEICRTKLRLSNTHTL